MAGDRDGSNGRLTDWFDEKRVYRRRVREKFLRTVEGWQYDESSGLAESTGRTKPHTPKEVLFNRRSCFLWRGSVHIDLGETPTNYGLITCCMPSLLISFKEAFGPSAAK